METLRLITDGFTHEDLVFFGATLGFIAVGLIVLAVIAIKILKEE